MLCLMLSLAALSHRLCLGPMPTNEHSYLRTRPSRRLPRMSSTCPTLVCRSCSSSVIFIKMFFSATSLVVGAREKPGRKKRKKHGEKKSEC